MKVKQLQNALEDFDPDARVLITIQPHHPIECHTVGAVQRDWYDRDSERPSNDVLIVQGGDVGYGSREAWDHA